LLAQIISKAFKFISPVIPSVVVGIRKKPPCTPFKKDTNENLKGSANTIDDWNSISIWVSKLEMMYWDLKIVQPFVRFYLLHRSTGEIISLDHLSKSHDSCNINRLQRMINPISTSVAKTKIDNKVVTWNQNLILMIHPDLLLSNANSLIILVEVLDTFLGKEEKISKTSKRCRPIAWGIMRWRSDHDFSKSLHYTRLPLFQYRRISTLMKSKVSTQGIDLNKVPNVYLQYLCLRYLNHHSHLTLKISCGLSSTEIVNSACSDKGEDKNCSLMSSQIVSQVEDDSKRPLFQYHRRPDEMCIIPTKYFLTLDVGNNGCNNLKFSNNGRYIAVVSSSTNQSIFSLVIFVIETGIKVSEVFGAHHDSVNSLDWSENDEYLLSCSSDGTAKVWKTPLLEIIQVVKSMPWQPIYYAIFESQMTRTCSDIVRVLIGLADGHIKVKASDSADDYHLISIGSKDNDKHEGSVISMIMDKKIHRLYSGDDYGRLYIWGSQIDKVQTLRYQVLRRIEILKETMVQFPIKRMRLSYLCKSNGSLLISANPGGVIKVFNIFSQNIDLMSPSTLKEFSYEYCPSTEGKVGTRKAWIDAFFAPDGRFVVCSGDASSIQFLKSFHKKERYPAANIYVGKNFKVNAIDWNKSYHILAFAASRKGNVIVYCAKETS